MQEDDNETLTKSTKIFGKFTKPNMIPKIGLENHNHEWKQ